MLGICLISTAGFSQETVLAANVTVPVTPVPETDPAEGEEEEQEAPTFTLSGTIDTYFHTSFGTTHA